MNKIAMIMAAYNGGKYIEQQIESIRNQTHTDWELFVFDDRSTDQTYCIVEGISKTDSRVKIIRNDENAGATYNFLNALEHVFKLSSFDYYMFADQDDIWMPGKIAQTLALMQEEEKTSDIVLVHTDLRLVDATGRNVVADSFRKHGHLKHIEDHVFERLLAQPFVFGCTVMMNNALVRRMYPIPKGVYAHDSWASLIAAALGKVSYLDTATIDFRRHGANVSGSAAANSMRNRLLRITTGWKAQISITNRRIAQCKALIGYIGDAQKPLKVLNQYCHACDKSGYQAIRATIKLKILRQGFFANILYYITLFFIERKRDGGKHNRKKKSAA